MTGKTMEVPRDLAVDICNGLRITQERAVAELRGLLAKTACIDCKETGFCLSITGDEIRCPCHAPIQFAKPAESQAGAKPQIEPVAQLLSDGVNLKSVANEQKVIIEQQNLIASLRAELSESYRIDSKPQGEPVAFQWRCKAVNEGSQWRHWVDCTEEDYNKTIENPGPSPRGIIREARKLYIRPAEQPAPVAVMPELTAELRWILGQMCFQHIHTAQALRTMGHQIARKAEDEQAVTIYWMLGHYLKDPLNWRQNAMDEMKAAAPAA